MGENDAAFLISSNGKVIYSRNHRKMLIPASTLKLITSLLAFHHLTPNFRFKTDFYLDSQNNLKIKGYGDPLLISEVIEKIAKNLKKKVFRINALVLDDSYFESSIRIPGRSKSMEPYDAPNGALCVNFNTVFFKQVNGMYVTAEEQTPLLPLAVEKIKVSGLKQGRITLSHNRKEVLRYVAEIFQHFLEKNGIKINEKYRIGVVNTANDRLLYRYESEFSLKELVAKLLEYSNNYIANQVFIRIGAHIYDGPGNLDKGVRAARNYSASILGINDIKIVEGSGISRSNKISAAMMMKVLEHFYPHIDLLKSEKRDFYKTGTLKGINTRAGYIATRDGHHYPYVIFLNTPGKTTESIMKIFLKHLK